MAAASPRITVRVGPDDFDVGAEIDALQAGDPAVGAVTSFVGYCRDEGGRLAALELEYYPGMAEAEIGRVVNEAVARWPLLAVTVIHREAMSADAWATALTVMGATAGLAFAEAHGLAARFVQRGDEGLVETLSTAFQQHLDASAA